MGSSYSKKSRTSPVRERKKGSSNTKIRDTQNNTASGKTEVEKNVDSKSGNIVHERKDSKKFWVSHVKFRRRSGELRRNSSEKIPEIKNDPEEIPKQTQHVEEDSKNMLRKTLSDQPEGKYSRERTLQVDASVKSDNTDDVKLGNAEQEANCLEHSFVVNTNKVSTKYRSLTVVELYNIVNDGALSPFICDPTYVLILDTRSKDLYDRNHVLLAKPSSSVYSDLQSYNHLHGFSTSTDISNIVGGFTWIIIYGDPFDLQGDNIEARPEIKLCNELEGNFEAEPYILSTGFISFEQAFPFLCTHQKNTDYKTLKVYPSMILDNQLYQGRGDQATNIKVIEDLKITHIVNITQEHKSAFPDKVEYLTLKLDDIPQTQLLKHFERTSAFLVNAFSNGGRALVHCNLGVSRSSSVSIAYLIQSRGWTLKKAHDFIKDQRTCIRPNRGFLKQLSLWEEKILGKKYTDPDDLWF